MEQLDEQQYMLDIDQDEEQQLSPLLRENLINIADTMTKISLLSTQRIKEYWTIVADDIQNNKLSFKESSNNILFSFSKWEYHIEKPTVSPICSKSIADSPNKKAFRCFDCMSINTALLCYDCFSKSNHKGHSYRQFQSLGGCCDCGDSQLWSQNGFCPDHNSRAVVPNLQMQLVNNFKRQILFLFYFYFLLVLKQNEFKEMRQQLGKKLFAYLINISNKDYESKVLVGQLLNSSLQDVCKDGLLKGKLIAMIFNMSPKHMQLEDLKSISFSMYPVESFRSVLLRQYFDLTAKNQFIYEHPLKKFNFQYLICVQAIVKMIKQKQLKPIQLSRTIPLKEKDNILSIFKKYFEDISYMRKTKESQQYFQIHFSTLSVNQMLFYRQMTNIEGGYQLDLDQFAIKLLGACLEYFKNNKLLLKKGMGQLFIEIQNNQKLSYCMPHERAFALYLMAYLQGNLQILQDEMVKDQITNILGFNEQNKSGYKEIFKRIIKKGLLNLTYLEINKLSGQRNDYQKYFFSVYPEKNFVSSLDLIYHKSLYLLSHSIIDYVSIVQEVFQELHYKQNGEVKIATLSIFVARMLSDTFNEPCIANFLGYADIEYTRMFDLRLIATYSNKMSIKQLKSLSNYFINNPQIFDKILHQYVRLQKGRIKLTQDVQPLQRLLYNDYFIHFKYNSQINCKKTGNLQLIPFLQKLCPFTPSIIDLLINNCLKTYEQYHQQNDLKNKQSYSKILQLQINGLLMVFLLTKSKQIIDFFNKTGYEASKYFECNNFRQQIGSLLVQKHSAEKNKQEMIDQQEQLKRKQKIAIKRKEKQAIIRTKQQAALKQFLPSAENSENAEQCVYCKQSLDKQYRLMGFVNLTNFVGKQFKSSQIHFFMTTCNHKMHQHCYNKYLGEKKTIQTCFLCKKKTNFAIFKREVSSQNAQSVAIEFFDNLFIALMSVYGQNDERFNSYYTSQCNENILQLVIVGFCKELLYFGLHQFASFKKYALQGYFVLYDMLAHTNKQWLKEAFENILNSHRKTSIQQNLLFQLQGFCYEFLQQKFVPSKILQDKTYKVKDVDKVKTLIQIIQRKSSLEILIESLNLITMDRIFIKVPNNIHDLHQMMGECPYCKKITNWLYYCLLCGWKCCNKQIDHFYKHSRDHYEGSLFISAGNGKTSIISMKNVSNQESIYENEFGQEYSHVQDNLKKQTLLSYKLNEAKLHNLFLKLLTHSLQNN